MTTSSKIQFVTNEFIGNRVLITGGTKGAGKAIADPVVDESGRLQGYCGRAELFAALRELPSLETSISDFMRKNPPVISADQSIIDAAVIMLREEIEMLAVVSSDGGVIGVVSPLDVIRTANAPLSRDSTLAIAQGDCQKSDSLLTRLATGEQP